jgi:hypothetical protein
MDFEKEYTSLVGRFTEYLLRMPHRTYVAPGDSAAAMVDRMKYYARTNSLALPIIHLLSHEQSWQLYGSPEVADVSCVSPFTEEGPPRTVHFLEDHYWSGDKISFMRDRLAVRAATTAKFVVMVGSDRKRWVSPNVKIFTQNNAIASTLFNTYNRRRSRAAEIPGLD